VDRKELQAALDDGGTLVIQGVVHLDRPLVVRAPVRIEGGLLLGPADVVLLDVQAPTTIVGTEVVRTGGFGHVIRTTSELRLDKVKVSGARNWSWEQARRPPLPTEWQGAGVFVTHQGSLKATALKVTGCTGAGVAAGGPVRWTRGAARSCRWGLFVSTGAAVVRDVSFTGNAEGVCQEGTGTAEIRRCRLVGNSVALAAAGPGRVLLLEGKVRGSQEVGVLAHCLGDVRIEDVSFTDNRVYAISASGWCDVVETGCTIEHADGNPVCVDDLARVSTGHGVSSWPPKTRVTLRDQLGRRTEPLRAEILRRCLERSSDFEDLRPHSDLLSRWGKRGLEWLEDDARELLWHAPLPGESKRVLRDPVGRIWFLTDQVLLSEGVRIEQGGSHVAIGEVIALASSGGLHLFELDGTPIATGTWPPGSGPVYRVDVVSRTEIQVHCVVGVGYDQHARQFTWHVADDTWSDAWTNTPSADGPHLHQVLQEAAWLGVSATEAGQAWCEGELGALALSCGVAVIVERRS